MNQKYPRTTVGEVYTERINVKVTEVLNVLNEEPLRILPTYEIRFKGEKDKKWKVYKRNCDEWYVKYHVEDLLRSAKKGELE